MINDTICAIATPIGVGAISIIRVSGEDAINKVNNIFYGKDLTKAKSHTIHYGHILDIDEVMVAVMRGPKSFTAEDTVEINCHGGRLITYQILEELLNQGARLALPGEFSKRAYLNGRIDLVQAEAIMDLINANSKKAITVANSGLSGRQSSIIKDFEEKIITLISKIEVNIDYPEYDDVTVITNEGLKPDIKKLISELDDIIERSNNGRIFRDGVKTAIVGRPNVGKSSLLNFLLEEDRAIVSKVPGTTRDTIDGFISIGGIALNIIDTAGIRKAKNDVEKIGVNRTIDVINNADLILIVLDNSQELTKEDISILELTKEKKRIIILNKGDLDRKINYQGDIVISAEKKEGLSKLEETIMLKLGFDKFVDDSNYLSNTRHIDLLKKCRKSLSNALKSIEEGIEVDLISIDLSYAFDALKEILGETTSIIDELFSRFCLGK